jgi:hypothetical protein
VSKNDPKNVAAKLRRFRVTLDDKGFVGALDAELTERLARALEAGKFDNFAWGSSFRLNGGVKHDLRRIKADEHGPKLAERAALLANAIVSCRPKGWKD